MKSFEAELPEEMNCLHEDYGKTRSGLLISTPDRELPDFHLPDSQSPDYVGIFRFQGRDIPCFYGCWALTKEAYSVFQAFKDGGQVLVCDYLTKDNGYTSPLQYVPWPYIKYCKKVSPSGEEPGRIYMILERGETIHPIPVI